MWHYVTFPVRHQITSDAEHSLKYTSLKMRHQDFNPFSPSTKIMTPYSPGRREVWRQRLNIGKGLTTRTTYEKSIQWGTECSQLPTPTWETRTSPQGRGPEWDDYLVGPGPLPDAPVDLTELRGWVDSTNGTQPPNGPNKVSKGNSRTVSSFTFILCIYYWILKRVCVSDVRPTVEGSVKGVSVPSFSRLIQNSHRKERVGEGRGVGVGVVGRNKGLG